MNRPGSQNSQLYELKSALISEVDKARPSSTGLGSWFSQGGGPMGGPSRFNSRPNTRNSQRSVAGQDFSPPPPLVRPPKLQGLRSSFNAQRPRTAPDGQTLNHAGSDTGSGFLSDHVRVPGAPGVPMGQCTGYVL